MMMYVFLLQPSSPVPAAPAAAAPVAQEQHWPTLGDSKEVPKKKKGTSTPPESTAAAGPSSKVSMQEFSGRRKTVSGCEQLTPKAVGVKGAWCGGMLALGPKGSLSAVVDGLLLKLKQQTWL
jgi:hypothetical protein